jgi:hypothetical protein
LGLRPTIRFQRHLEAWIKSAWDVKITRLEDLNEDGVGIVELCFPDSSSPDVTFIKSGELIELLDAYRVIGVGQILNVTSELSSYRKDLTK